MRTGVTPANSPDPIPAVMRAPVAPSIVPQRTADFGSGERSSGAVAPPRAGDIGGRWSPPDLAPPRGTRPADGHHPRSSGEKEQNPGGPLTGDPAFALEANNPASAWATRASNPEAEASPPGRPGPDWEPATGHPATTEGAGGPRAVGRVRRVAAVPTAAAQRAMAAAAMPPGEDVAAGLDPLPAPGETTRDLLGGSESGPKPPASSWAGTAAAFDVDATMTNPWNLPADGEHWISNSARGDVTTAKGAARRNSASANHAEAVAVTRRQKAGNPPRGGRVTPSRATVRLPAAPRVELIFRPVVRVRNMRATVAFFEFLGAELVHGDVTSEYVLLQLGVVQLALVTGLGVAKPGDGPVELNFGTTMPLDHLEARLRDHRVSIDERVHHPDFGLRLHVRTPDGLLLHIEQLEPVDGA